MRNYRITCIPLARAISTKNAPAQMRQAWRKATLVRMPFRCSVCQLRGEWGSVGGDDRGMLARVTNAYILEYTRMCTLFAFPVPRPSVFVLLV